MRKLLFAAIVFAGIGTTACGLMDTCGSGEVSCHDGCMPSGADCCNSGGYCDPGYYCNNVNTCSSGGGGGGGGLYVSGSSCTGVSSVSYTGSNHDTCLYYYNAARAANCQKILWKC